MQQPQLLTLKQQTKALIRRFLQHELPYAECVRAFKKEFLVLVLVAHRGNQCWAARCLGMHRNTLGRALAELKIDAQLIRSACLRPAAEARIKSRSQRRAVRQNQARRKPSLITAAAQRNAMVATAITAVNPMAHGDTRSV